MLYQMSCGHVDLNREWPVDVPYCPWCMEDRRVTAVECREWKATCYSCRYARWCGQARNEADLLASRHLKTHPSHQITTDYLMHPDLERIFKRLYKKVKPRIINYPEKVIPVPPPCTPCATCSELKCSCVPF